MPITPTPQQFPQWESDLLAALGAPNSTENLTALNLWAQSEGNVINNALATSGQGAGATVCVAQCGSSSPIYEYATEADGVAQMSHFLGGSYYTAIVRAFQQNAGLAAIYQAVNASPWCKGCQNGHYPEALAAAVGGGATSISPGVGGGGGTTTPSAAPGSAPGTGTGASACAWGINVPSASNAIVQFFTLGLVNTGGQAQICFLSKTQWKALSGAAVFAFGAGLLGFGVVLLAAWGFEASGAKQAVGKVTRAVGIPASLFAGQPEIAAGLAASRGKGRSGAKTQQQIGRSSDSSTQQTGRRPSTNVRVAGRRESRQIEDQYRRTVEQQGPIGPRGANAASRRAYERRTSYPGGGRPRTPEQRAAARQRASEPF